MSIHFPSVPATFIHIPKTGGLSFRHWAFDHLKDFDFTRDQEHSDLIQKHKYWPNLGTTFTFVRNPYARLVSIYHFLGQRAEMSKKTDQDFKELLIFRKGFNHWIRNDVEYGDIWSKKKQQVDWFSNRQVDIILKIEEIDQDFKKIQELLNCYEPLPHINKSIHDDYRSYYDQETKKLVENLCRKDLERFGYDF